MQKPNVTITTDGASRGNPGPGGWAALLEFEKDGESHERMITGEDTTNVTNNAMEVMAVAGGLQALKKACTVVLRIDSQYVIKGIKKLLDGWNGITEHNQEQWHLLVAALHAHDHDIEIEWVKGHSGDERNERVDTEATAAANRAYANSDEQTSIDSDWSVVVCMPTLAIPSVRWYANNGEREKYDQIEVGKITANTAAWQGVADAIQWLYDNAEGRYPSVLVQTNLEMIVKQARGEWKIKTPEHKPHAQRVAQLRAYFEDMQFQWAKTEVIEPLFN